MRDMMMDLEVKSPLMISNDNTIYVGRNSLGS